MSPYESAPPQEAAPPYEEPPPREPALRAPASVLVLIGLIVVAHAARVLSPMSDAIVNRYALDPIVYSAATLKAIGAAAPGWFDLVVPPLSHIFLHAGLLHLAVNSVWLLAFGPVVARRFGAVGFYLFFLACGLGGAIGFVALDWGQDVGAIGASGAISGLMAAAIRMMRLRGPDEPLEPLLSSQVLIFTAIWLATNLAAGLTGLGATGPGETIAWQDHLGGYIAGLLLAGPFDHLFGYRRVRA
jgi:membrane associated rhomboid family serine protease